MTVRFVGLASAAAIFFFCGAREAAATAYSYYNRPGADMTALDSDLAGCVRTIGVISVPSMGGIIFDAFARANEHAFFRASMENCMVARDWRVVSVTQDEGAQWAGLPADQLSGVLAPMVGALEPHGEVARTFSNVVMKMPNGLTALWPYPSRYSLSDARFDWKQFRDARPDRPPLPRIKSKILKPIALEKTGPVPPDKVMFVIRLAAGEDKSGRMLSLARVPDSTADVDVVESLGGRTAGGLGQEKVSIFIGSPGLWYLDSVVAAQTCMGAPAFEAKAGETLFLGSFQFGDSLKLDTSLPPDQPAIPSEVKARMKSADWKNGFTFQCTGLYAMAVRFDGLPSRNVSPAAPGAADRPGSAAGNP